jgi:hypothetical protein
MKIYMWSADLYCGPCGEAIAATLPDPDAWEREHPDSNSYCEIFGEPVGYDSSEGESDTPDHCGECEIFLERNLTEEGVRYVRDAIRELALGYGRDEIVQQWAEFYGIAKAEEVGA